jgi:glycosyltransferase 2 family protein
MHTKRPQRLKFFLRLILTLLLIGGIVWYLEDLTKLSRLITNLSPVYLVLIYIVSTLDRAFMTFKWSLLLRSRGLSLPFLPGFKIYCAAMIWGMFLPATIGADAFRAISTSRLGLDVNEVAASIFIERMVGFLSALLLGMLGLVLLSLAGHLDDRFSLLWWISHAMFVGTIAVFVASFSHGLFTFLHERLLHRWEHPILQRFRQFHTTYRSYRHDRHTFVLFFALTLVEQFCMNLNIWVIAQGLGIEVSLLFIAGVVPVAFLLARLPVSLNGLGVYDGVFMFFMAMAGIPSVEAIAIVVVGRTLEILSWLPWWAAHVFSNTRTSQGVSKMPSGL